MPQTRTSVWILGDQLLLEHPALLAAQENASLADITVLLIESRRRTARHPYQRKKLVLLFSAMRHYAGLLRERGFRVDYRQDENFQAGLEAHIQAHQPASLWLMAAAEYPARQWQQQKLPGLLHAAGVAPNLLPNTQFLLGQYNPYDTAPPDKRVIMEHFYRAMRRHFRVLLADDEPVGGAWNFDHDNRKPLPKGEQAPLPPRFEPDSITQTVMAEVAALDNAVGTVEGFDLAVTHMQAAYARDVFFAERLPKFGPYEDAMSTGQDTLYHAVLSPYLNLGLLEPLDLIRRAETAYHEGHAPINSVEGFVRQILGWREYIYWQYWRLMPDLYRANAWQAERPVPSFFWTGETDLNCLHHVLRRAIGRGYNHHIERLMMLSNFFMLTGVNPAAANDWFLALYIDAYEWVMVPNVVGMGLNADGGRTATKPYIASANYINKMSDYCRSCRYQPRQRTGPDACPFNALYWNFLLQHEARLRANPRLGRNVLGLRHLDEAERDQVREDAAAHIRSWWK